MRISAPQDFVGGICLVGICLFVFWAVDNLSQGTFEHMGPAMFPRMLALLLGLGGIFLIVKSFLTRGEALEKSSVRGPVLVTGGIIAFALTIQTLGLAVAGVLALIISGFAIEDSNPRGVVIFAVAATLACIILFRYLLGMAIPVLIIPGTSIDF